MYGEALGHHTLSPTATSLACLRFEQHEAPTGRRCSGARVRVALAAVASVMYVASASGWARERDETTSVVRAPVASAATMTSPALREATLARVPSSAMVTVEVAGKHGAAAEAVHVSVTAPVVLTERISYCPLAPT